LKNLCRIFKEEIRAGLSGFLQNQSIMLKSAQMLAEGNDSFINLPHH